MSALLPGLYSATVRGVPDQIVMIGDWTSSGHVMHGEHVIASDITDARPLIVLDLAAPDRFATLLRSFDDMGDTVFTKAAEQIEAQCKPARIPEPGLWGVVSALIAVDRPIVGDLNEWVHRIDGWHCPIHGHRPWDDLIDPTLIREGVES